MIKQILIEVFDFFSQRRHPMHPGFTSVTNLSKPSLQPRVDLRNLKHHDCFTHGYDEFMNRYENSQNLIPHSNHISCKGYLLYYYILGAPNPAAWYAGRSWWTKTIPCSGSAGRDTRAHNLNISDRVKGDKSILSVDEDAGNGVYGLGRGMHAHMGIFYI